MNVGRFAERPVLRAFDTEQRGESIEVVKGDRVGRNTPDSGDIVSACGNDGVPCRAEIEPLGLM
jgi:hypothetical protein